VIIDAPFRYILRSAVNRAPDLCFADMHGVEERDVTQCRPASRDLSSVGAAMLRGNAGPVRHHDEGVLRVPPWILPPRGHSLLTGTTAHLSASDLISRDLIPVQNRQRTNQ